MSSLESKEPKADGGYLDSTKRRWSKLCVNRCKSSSVVAS